MTGTQWPNLAVILGYLGCLLGLCVYFSRRQTSTETYFVARRAVPGWAMGISLLATIITSVTFVAYPGAAYAGDWSLIVPGIMMVAVPLLAGFVIVPFYRRVVRMSAYEYFGRRFGPIVRTYASVMFSLGHLSKMSFVLYLLALTVNSMTGWRVDAVLLATIVIAVVFAFAGGLEAIIWADVLQGIVLWCGVLVSVGYLLVLNPAKPTQIFQQAWDAHKFGLGNTSMNLATPGVLVLCLYGFFFYLQKYTADQTVVQRYLAARSDRGALRGILLGAALCIPVWSLFMLVGTLLWSYYQVTGEVLPARLTKADQIFPYFIVNHLPAGVPGIFLAALFGAGISMLASDLNCLGVVGLEDMYARLKSGMKDTARLKVGRWVIVLSGAIVYGVALILAHTPGTALALYYAVASIVAGGLAGLFLLAFLSDRANSRGALAGILANIVFTIWATLTGGSHALLKLKGFSYPWHEYMTGVVGHVLLVAIGYLVSRGFSGSTSDARELTIWVWLGRKQQSEELLKAGLPELKELQGR
jgi:SSS family solute:Na+ symporter